MSPRTAARGAAAAAAARSSSGVSAEKPEQPRQHQLTKSGGVSGLRRPPGKGSVGNFFKKQAELR